MDFGGDWTVKKLDVLKRYLNSYTTALKGQHFRLVYIDAFAGDGTVKFETPDSEFRSVVDGSARLALEVKDKQFDRLVFVEQDGERCEELRKLQDHYSNRRVDIVQADANTFLQWLDLDRFAWRGVLFVDPFATQVEWATVQTIASFEALDMWLLFPLSAIARMLPRSRSPGTSIRRGQIASLESTGMRAGEAYTRKVVSNRCSELPKRSDRLGLMGCLRSTKGTSSMRLGPDYLKRVSR